MYLFESSYRIIEERIDWLCNWSYTETVSMMQSARQHILKHLFPQKKLQHRYSITGYAASLWFWTLVFISCRLLSKILDWGCSTPSMNAWSKSVFSYARHTQHIPTSPHIDTDQGGCIISNRLQILSIL